MWWTPDGERVLRGREAALFREALGVLTDLVRDDEKGDLCQFGMSVFDGLQRSQKLAVLAEVGTALLREETPPLALTAVRDSVSRRGGRDGGRACQACRQAVGSLCPTAD
jgi:hypothetical protein